MAYDRLQGLGELKFRKILNALMRGETAESQALIIQQEWMQFQDTAYSTLCQQLRRLRLSAAEGMFGKEIADQIQQGFKPQIKLIEGISPSAVERLEALSKIQSQRVDDLVAREKFINHSNPRLIQAVNEAITGYSEVLKDIQAMRFSLGVDEFHGPVTTIRGARESTTLPDGTNVQRQVFEAVTTMEQIFDRRKVPHIASGA